MQIYKGKYEGLQEKIMVSGIFFSFDLDKNVTILNLPEKL